MNSLVNIQYELQKVGYNYKAAATLTSIDRIKKFLISLSEEKFHSSHELPDIDYQNINSEKNSLFSDRKNVNTKTILIRCLNEEESLIKAYQKSLTIDNLSSQERYIIHKQLNEALVNYNQLRVIKQSRNYQ